MKLTLKCPYCNADQVKKLESKDRVFLVCGHSYKKVEGAKLEQTENIADFTSLSGKQAFDFQIEGVKFGLANNGNFMNQDAMGNGKTMQSILVKKLLGKSHMPVLVIVKSATTIGWAREWNDWFSDADMSCYIILGKQTYIPRGFDCYIISMDSLPANVMVDSPKKKDRFGKTYDIYKPDEMAKIRKDSPIYRLNINSVIVDECHSFKDDSSQRTRSLITFVRENNLVGKITFLSGTPIKNRADEYFVPLNLLRPDEFPFRSHFRTKWLEKNERGQWSNIKPWKLDEFKNLIAPFVIRREKSKSLPPHFELPPLVVELTDPDVKNSYNRQLQQFQFRMDTEKMSSISILGEIAKLRQITALAKIPFFIDYAEESFENFKMEREQDPTYPAKLAVGIHHKAVRDQIKLICDSRFPNWKTFSLTGEDDTQSKQTLVDDFNANPAEERLGIISQLAGGVGLNIQGCCNYVILEREWSPADEDQFISRFHRTGQKHPVHGRIISAANTIDEFFDDIVNEKKQIFGETIVKDWSLTQDSASLKKLIDRTLSGGI